MGITPATEDNPTRIQQAGSIPDDWKYICKATSIGYAFELAIYLFSAWGLDAEIVGSGIFFKDRK